MEVHHELGAVDEAVDPGGGESGDAGRVLQEDVRGGGEEGQGEPEGEALEHCLEDVGDDTGEAVPTQGVFVEGLL